MTPASSTLQPPAPAVQRTSASSTASVERDQRAIDVHQLLVRHQERLEGQGRHRPAPLPDPEQSQRQQRRAAPRQRPEHRKPDSRLARPPM